MKTLNVMSLQMASSYNCILDMVNETINFINCSYGPVENDIIFDIKVILNELITNAIKHGNKCDPSKYVSITAGITEDKGVFISIEDDGQGFDYERKCKEYDIACREEDINEMNESGRGMMIIRHLCDRLDLYNKGSKITIYKKLYKV